MKILNNKLLKIFDIDPYQLRGKNFYKSIDNYRKEIFRKLSKYIVNDSNLLQCRLCKSKKKSEFLNWRKKYKLYLCSNCNLVYPNIKIKSEDYYLNNVYEDISYTKKFKREITSNFEYRKKNFGLERYNYTIKRLKINRNNKILDLGCGAGYYLKFLKEKKFKTKGLEVANHLVKYCNEEQKLNVCRTSLEEEPNNEYGLITMFDVLEHLSDPINTFKNINRKLKKNGFCVAYSPNIHSLAYEIMGAKQNTLLPFEHLCFFNKKSLEFLVKKTGFSIYSIDTYGFDIMDFFMFKEFEDKKRYIKNFKDLIFKTQSIIDHSGMSNHLRVTFKKKKQI